MSYNGRKNNLTKNILSDEWYTPQFLVHKCFKIIEDNKNYKTVLCPFDESKSMFVKTFKENYDCKFGMQDFLDDRENYDCDIVITNPPFSLKEQVFQKCLSYNKDFILVLPETYIFSVGFFDLILKYNFHYKLYSPKQRVYFIDQNGNQNRPNFHTVLVYVSKSFDKNEIEHFYSEAK